jgi:hypothetical protein
MYGKPLVDGSSAVMVLNRGETNLTLSVNAEDVGNSMHSFYNVRDLWQHQNLTMTTHTTLTHAASMNAYDDEADDVGEKRMFGAVLLVPPHGVRMLRMWPADPPPPPPPAPPAP